MTRTPQYQRWNSVIETIASRTSSDSRVILFLHLPKTGGTTATNCMKVAKDWKVVRMKESFISSDACSCGDPDCVVEESHADVGVREGAGHSENWFCHFVHERYDAPLWFAEELRRRGGPPAEIHVSHRPARKRLVSMFKDYWRMAFGGGYGLAATPHEERVIARYRADSQAYVDGSGMIDGNAWFRAFSSFGTGMPFSMADVFDGSVMNLRLSLASGDMNVVQTEKMDDWLGALTGVDHVVHRRVSGSAPENVLVALDEARHFVDQLAERDWTYDQAVDEYELMSRLGRRFRA